MAKLSTDELLDAFKETTLIELYEFVKPFEETFDVTAAAPVAAAASRRAAAAAPAEVEEQDGVRRHPRGRRRQEDPGHRGGPLSVTSLGPKEAKDLVDGAPEASP